MSLLTFLPTNLTLDEAVDSISKNKNLLNTGLDKTKIKKSLLSFDGDILATTVYLEKYALRDRNNKILELTLDESWDRWITSIEKIDKTYSNPVSNNEWHENLKPYFLPGGRQMLGLGNDNIDKLTVNNCYFTNIQNDSLESIFETGYKIAKTFSYSGGQGIDIGVLRPKNSLVSNTARTSTGAVSFIELYSCITGLIGQHGRRAALMISIPVDHPDIEDFIEFKHTNQEKGQYANLSIKITNEFMQAVIEDKEFVLKFDTQHEQIKRTVKAKELFNKICKAARDSGEPGILFWDTIKYSSPSEIYQELQLGGTNPCITGETLVYVADGRGNISIKQLAEENKDIPVFCLNKQNQVTVRYMRNPRITGYKTPIYKITLDDGSIIRTTKNHKLLLADGTYKETQDLQPGDSLKLLTKFEASVKDIFSKINSRSQDYFWINNGFKNNQAEHRIIAGFYNNINLKNGSNLVVHHKDRNTKNNNPDNLEIMTKQNHDAIHVANMVGNQNPMRRARNEWDQKKWNNYKLKHSINNSAEKNKQAYPITNEELLNHAIELSKSLNRRFSVAEWAEYAKENNLPCYFSKWRRSHFNGVCGLSKIAAIKCGFENVNLDPRILRTYNKLIDQGYDCKIINNDIFINKKCEICNNNFQIHFSRREVGICNYQCFLKKLINKNKDPEICKKRIINQHIYQEKFKKENAVKLIQAFSDLKYKLQRDPFYKELANYCKENNILHRIGKFSYFKNYQELKDYATLHNHKIMSIEFDGYEDVYNGTVDEFHNFFIGGFENTTNNNKKKWYYFNNLQCGELPLSDGDACCLGSLILHRFIENPFTNISIFNWTTFRQAIKLGVRFLDNVIDYNLDKNPLPEQKRKAQLGRRIGLGITGLADCLAALGIVYDSPEAQVFVKQLMSYKQYCEYFASIDLAIDRGSFELYNNEKHFEQPYTIRLNNDIIKYSKQYGLRNVVISTIAPNGSLSIMAHGCTSGIEPLFAKEQKRRVILGAESKEFTFTHSGILVARYYGLSEEKINKLYPTAYDIDWKKRIELQSILQKYTDSAISSTINLRSTIPVEEVYDIYLEAWKHGLKGITIYRDSSRENIISSATVKPIVHAEIDTKCFSFVAECGDKFYVHVSYDELKNPYQVFATNYKATEHDRFTKLANDIKMLLSNKGIPIALLKDREDSEKKINKQCERSKNSLDKITRLTSLALKAGYINELVAILDKHAIIGTLAYYLYHIFINNSSYVKVCVECGSVNLKGENGCITCKDCGHSRCG